MRRIRPFYAVKSNPSEFIIRVLNKLGAGFDCASIRELDLVRDQCDADFDFSSRVIYAHPCKPVSHIRRFKDAGVQLTVVDNKDELRKLKFYWPEAKVSHHIHPLRQLPSQQIDYQQDLLFLFLCFL
jgi:ornithine decarboxylase